MINCLVGVYEMVFITLPVWLRRPALPGFLLPLNSRATRESGAGTQDGRPWLPVQFPWTLARLLALFPGPADPGLSPAGLPSGLEAGSASAAGNSLGAAERFSVIPRLLRQAVPHKPLKWTSLPGSSRVQLEDMSPCPHLATAFLIRSHHPLLLGEAGGGGGETLAFTDGAFLPLRKPS